MHLVPGSLYNQPCRCPWGVCPCNTCSASLLVEPANRKIVATSLSLGRDLEVPGLGFSGRAGGSPGTKLLEKGGKKETEIGKANSYLHTQNTVLINIEFLLLLSYTLKHTANHFTNNTWRLFWKSTSFSSFTVLLEHATLVEKPIGPSQENNKAGTKGLRRVYK